MDPTSIEAVFGGEEAFVIFNKIPRTWTI